MKEIKDDENFDKIKVFSSDDEKLKMLGELLSNKSSRDIIRLLTNKEMYINEIAKKLDMRANLVIHHLKKLEELELLEIKNKKIVKKGNEHRHFKMIPNLFVVPNHTKEGMEKTRILKKIFKEGVKITAVFLIAVSSTLLFSRSGQKMDDSDADVILQFIPDSSSKNFSLDIFLISIIGMVILSCGFLIFFRKKRKRWIS